MNSDELKKRTKEFAHRTVKLALTLPKTTLGDHERRQLVRCATSVAANYRSALLSQTKASFISKISIVIEEADESEFWLEFIMDEKLIEKEMCSICGNLILDYVFDYDGNKLKVCCSELCSERFKSIAFFSGSLAHRRIERDKGICKHCGVSGYAYFIWFKNYREWCYSHEMDLYRFHRKEYENKTGDLMPKIIEIEADHIVAISLGGDAYDINNLQTLCCNCHEIKTKIDVKELLKRRAERHYKDFPIQDSLQKCLV